MSEATAPQTETTGTGEQTRNVVEAYRNLEAAYDLAKAIDSGRTDEGYYGTGNSVINRNQGSISGRWTQVSREEPSTHHDFLISDDGTARAWVYKENEVEKSVTGQEAERVAIEAGFNAAEEVGEAARQKALDLIAAYDAVVGTPEIANEGERDWKDKCDAAVVVTIALEEKRRELLKQWKEEGSIEADEGEAAQMLTHQRDVKLRALEGAISQYGAQYTEALHRLGEIRE
jgi:hypothetical protein